MGLLRSLEAVDRELPENKRLYPRACWEPDDPPLRPTLCVQHPILRVEVAEIAASGLATLAVNHDFGERNQSDLNYTRSEARAILDETACAATVSARGRADLQASLMSDVVTTGQCQVLGWDQERLLARRRLDSSVARSIQRSISIFMTS